VPLVYTDINVQRVNNITSHPKDSIPVN